MFQCHVETGHTCLCILNWFGKVKQKVRLFKERLQDYKTREDLWGPARLEMTRVTLTVLSEDVDIENYKKKKKERNHKITC